MATAIGTLQRGRIDDPYLRPTSLPFRLRRARFAHIQPLIERAIYRRGQCHVLDVGGTEGYWGAAADFLQKHRRRLKISILNPLYAPVADPELFEALSGDGCDLADFPSNSIDLVHSNSVIEHVGAEERMRAFAAEHRRVGRAFYCQAPHFWFPIDPHFRALGFQFLPQNLQAFALMRSRIGFVPKQNSIEAARDALAHTKLVTMRQFRAAFPTAAIRKETVLGLTKSLIAVG